MKLLYYPETDSLYIEFNDRPGAGTREVVEGVMVDLDADGNAVGIDIERASEKLDLETLETSTLPLTATQSARASGPRQSVPSEPPMAPAPR